MIGFVNGLGIVIARAQFSTFAGLESWALWQAAALTAFTLAMIKFVKPPKGVPSPLVAIASCALLVRGLGSDVKTVGAVARVAGTLPSFHLPSVPMTFETLAIVAPVACSVAAVRHQSASDRFASFDSPTPRSARSVWFQRTRRDAPFD